MTLRTMPADFGGDDSGLPAAQEATERAIVALPGRVVSTAKFWPWGSTVVDGTDGVRDAIETLGDSDPMELRMPYPRGLTDHAALLVWEGRVVADTAGNPVFAGECRVATPAELVEFQAGGLIASWDALLAEVAQ